VIKVGNNTSAMLILNMGPLRGAYLDHSCTPSSPTWLRGHARLQNHH
jgi:hypothetical protein